MDSCLCNERSLPRTPAPKDLIGVGKTTDADIALISSLRAFAADLKVDVQV